jgi:hypothetical protein
VSIARKYATAVAALGCVVVLAASAATAATISLGTITNNSTCVTADVDDGNASEQPYNVGNAACSEPTGGADSNFFRVTNTVLTSSSAAPGGSTSVDFSIDAAVGVDSAVDGQDEYERGKIRYTLNFAINATAVENWTVGLSQNVLGLFGFEGDGPATAVGTQVFGNAGISTINVAVGATDLSFSPAPLTASSNVANTGTQAFGPISGSRNDPVVVSGTGNGAFSVTIAFDIDAFSNAGCTGFICSSASGGEDAAVLLGYDNVDDCCGGTVDRINADNYSTWGRAVGPDGYNSTWTFAVTSQCGNGVINGGEQCDTGAANGLATSCCTSLCTVRTFGSVCRTAAGVCDVAEVCDGSTGACPADTFMPSIAECRAASTGEACDLTETCTGTGPNCPPDLVKANGTTCRNGSGDVCDPAETCDGVSKTCPANTVSPPGTSCRVGSGDVCDLTETCTGVAGQACPPNDAPAKAGVVCRTGSGDMCDLNETCTGTPGATCPANDAPGKAGTVCRTGSGDTCDLNETCTGTPGAPCPANDAPGKGGTVCRAGSGDMCDVNETCTGTPGQPCPANDAPGKTGTVCRAGSGDMCDVNETCTGTPGATCPANDAPGKAGTVCRTGSGDVCDPNETCTGTPGAACPTNAVASSGTVCRAAAGACDVAEACSGTIGQTCPVDGFVPDGTGCPDGLFCNGEESCQSGVCTDNDNPCISSCDEGLQTCLATCPPAPLSGCRTAGKSILLLKDKSPDSKDKLLWKWTNGQATSITDFGQPTATTDYALCLYAGGAPIADAVVESDVQRWRLLSGKGYSYIDVSVGQSGIQRILLKGNATADRSKIFWKGKGTGLGDLAPGTLPLASGDFPVTVQMLNTASNACFESVFAESDAKRNRADQLKLKR